MLRPSPNHGTQRLPNDDDDESVFSQTTISPTPPTDQPTIATDHLHFQVPLGTASSGGSRQ